MEPPNAATANKTRGLMELLDEIEERANKATPGPWEQNPTGDMGDWIVGSTRYPVADCDFGELTRCQIADNSAFIASSRTDVPALVKALRHAFANYTVEVVDHAELEAELAAILTQAKQ